MLAGKGGFTPSLGTPILPHSFPAVCQARGRPGWVLNTMSGCLPLSESFLLQCGRWLQARLSNHRKLLCPPCESTHAAAAPSKPHSGKPSWTLHKGPSTVFAQPDWVTGLAAGYSVCTCRLWRLQSRYHRKEPAWGNLLPVAPFPQL